MFHSEFTELLAEVRFSCACCETIPLQGGIWRCPQLCKLKNHWCFKKQAGFLRAGSEPGWPRFGVWLRLCRGAAAGFHQIAPLVQGSFLWFCFWPRAHCESCRCHLGAWSAVYSWANSWVEKSHLSLFRIVLATPLIEILLWALF